MDWPTWRDLVFSMRTYCAAMLAIWVANWLPIPSPSIAVITIYVVALPFTGMMLSKSIYRVVGTLLGAVVALAFMALFAQARELFILANALWFGGSVYLAMLLRDRPVRDVALLSAFLPALAGFVAITQPENIFKLTTTRCVEVILGVVCYGILAAIVLPRPVVPMLIGRINGLLASTKDWALEALTSDNLAASLRSKGSRLVADTVELEALREHAQFESGVTRAGATIVRRLQGQLFGMFAILIATQERSRLVRQQDPQRWQAIAPALASAAQALEPSPSDQSSAEERIAEARSRIDLLQPSVEEIRKSQPAAIAHILLSQVSDFLSSWIETVQLRDHLVAGTSPSAGTAPTVFWRHLDYTAATIAAITASVALAATFCFWVATAWPQGASAAIMVVLIMGVCVSGDSPVAMAKQILFVSTAAYVLAMLYIALVLPRLDGFIMLAPALGLVLVPAGMLMSVPKFATSAFCIFFVNFLGLSSKASLDLAASMNSGLASLFGMMVVVLAFSLSSPVGADWGLRRLVSSIMTDLARMAGRGGPTTAEFESLMFDRINILFRRLAANDPRSNSVLEGSFASLHLGYQIMNLRSLSENLDTSAGQAIERTLSALSGHFVRVRRHGAGDRMRLMDTLADTIRILQGVEPTPDVINALTSVTAINSILSNRLEFFMLTQSHTVPTTSESMVPA